MVFKVSQWHNQTTNNKAEIHSYLIAVQVKVIFDGRQRSTAQHLQAKRTSKQAAKCSIVQLAAKLSH
jgi:hypothetical protein